VRTLQSLGLETPLFIVDGCDYHYGDQIPDPHKYTADACKSPTVFEVPRRRAERTVQDELDARYVAWDLGLFSLTTQEGPCPLCLAQNKSAPTVRVAHSSSSSPGEPPEHFFIAVSRRDESDYSSYARTPPKPAVCVSAYGERFRLCAVVYREKCQKESYSCFSCQALYDGCWHTYHSCTGDKSVHRHQYESSPPFEREYVGTKRRVPLDMEPILFAYVRDAFYLPKANKKYPDDVEEHQLDNPADAFDSAHEKVRKTPEKKPVLCRIMN